MRELTKEEMQLVNGGRLSWQAGGAIVLGLSIVSPVTFAFGFPIGMSMLAVAAFTEQ
jgi:lactobin A/cerein 7B family class IIb bacteriocin